MIILMITKVTPLVGVIPEPGDIFHLLCAFYILKSFDILLFLKTSYTGNTIPILKMRQLRFSVTIS